MVDGRTCMFCLAPTGLSVRFDRKGRAYLRCGACSTRAFLGSAEAIHGVAVLLPYAEQIVARMQQDGVYAAAKMEEMSRFREALRTRLQAVVPAQPSVVAANALATERVA